MIQQFSEITPSFAFTEFDFYKDYEESFKRSELGRIHALLTLHEMAIRFGLIDPHPRKNAGRKSYFSPKGKVALMFLNSYIGLSASMLMEALNGNIHYQIFCGIRISPENQLTNHKLIDDIILELSKRLRIQNQQEAQAEAWKPYMNLIQQEYKDRIRFIGRVTDVESVYNASDVVVLATTVEGVSNAIMEGMALGKPIVSTKGPFVGTAEVVEEGISGFLTEYHDDEKFADCILKLLNDERLRQQMGERGKQIVNEKFGILQMISNFTKLYDSFEK